MSNDQESIEVSGIRFSAEEVEAVTIKRDGRTITISEPREEAPRVGFKTDLPKAPHE